MIRLNLLLLFAVKPQNYVQQNMYLNDLYPLTLSKDELNPLESILNCVALINSLGNRWTEAFPFQWMMSA